MPPRLSDLPAKEWGARVTEPCRSVLLTEPLPWVTVRDFLEDVAQMTRDELDAAINFHLQTEAYYRKYPMCTEEAFVAHEQGRRAATSRIAEMAASLVTMLRERTIQSETPLYAQPTGILSTLRALADVYSEAAGDGQRASRGLTRNGDAGLLRRLRSTAHPEGEHYLDQHRRRIMVLKKQLAFLDWLLKTHYAQNPNTSLRHINLPAPAGSPPVPESTELVDRAGGIQWTAESLGGFASDHTDASSPPVQRTATQRGHGSLASLAEEFALGPRVRVGARPPDAGGERWDADAGSVGQDPGETNLVPRDEPVWPPRGDEAYTVRVEDGRIQWIPIRTAEREDG